jgi:hypothetical protein
MGTIKNDSSLRVRIQGQDEKFGKKKLSQEKIGEIILETIVIKNKKITSVMVKLDKQETPIIVSWKKIDFFQKSMKSHLENKHLKNKESKKTFNIPKERIKIA